MADPLHENTPVTGNLRGMLAMAAAILLGGLSAGAGAMKLMQRLAVVEEKVAQLPTREDLREATAKRMRATFVRCPVRRGGDGWVKCDVIQGENEP